jgi:ribosomal-protein-alanine N-acetyltransferase
MITTKRLELIPVDNKYSKDLFLLWNDFDVIKYTNATLIKTQNECNERIRLFIDNYTDWDYPNNFLILLDNRAIGIAGFPVISKEKSEFGFYYQLIKSCWNKGYASEAASALIKYIYNKYKKAVIYADALPVNPASIKILQKLGFEQIKFDKKGFKKNGFELDIFHFKYKEH